MSEVIVRMEMPLNCEHCPMSHWNKLNELTGCDAVGGKRYVSDDDEFWHMARPSWCPIVGVLPETHGDLINREYAIASACSGLTRTLRTTEGEEKWIRVKEVRESIKSAPIIVPAERSET